MAESTIIDSSAAVDTSSKSTNNKEQTGVSEIEHINTTSVGSPASSRSSSLSGDNPDNANASGEENQDVLDGVKNALRVQLEYYFSPSNLVRDAFLKSVMASSISPKTLLELSDEERELEGRFVPVAVLGRFGNVQKIINQFENQRRVNHQNSVSGETDSPTLENDVASGTKNKEDAKTEDSSATLTDESELEKDALYRKVPMLLREASLTSSLLDVVVLDMNYNVVEKPPLEDETDRSSYISKIMDIDVYRLGVGPTRLYYKNSLREAEEQQKQDAIRQGSQQDEQSDKSIIILRDLPASSTEQEVREVFSWENCPGVKDVTYVDVGNCWFVSLDCTKEDTIDTLLTLKKQKFKGEHEIKARLKIESSAKSSQTSIRPYVGDGYLQASYYNNGRPQYYRRSNGDGNGSFRNRMQQHPPYLNNSAPLHGRYNRSPFYRSSRYHETSSYASPRSVSEDNNDIQKAVPPPPPPPLEESHFPSLDGKNGVDASTNESKSTSMSGYAAALRKAAPPILAAVSGASFKKSTQASEKNKKHLPKTTKVPHKSITKSSVSTASTVTATDSADDSSSIAGGTTSTTSSSVMFEDTIKDTTCVWGKPSSSKKSFADILRAKKQNATLSVAADDK